MRGIIAISGGLDNSGSSIWCVFRLSGLVGGVTKPTGGSGAALDEPLECCSVLEVVDGLPRYFGSLSSLLLPSCVCFFGATRCGSGRSGSTRLVAIADVASFCCVGGRFAWCSCWCCCENGKMLNNVELRLCLFGGPGRSSAFRRSSAVEGSGSEAEWEWDTREATGLGGFVTVVTGRSAPHISHSVREVWLRKVQRGHCFFSSGVEGRCSGSAGTWGCGRGGCCGAASSCLRSCLSPALSRRCTAVFAVIDGF